MFRIAICDDMITERNQVIDKINTFFQKENLRYLISEYSSGESLLAEYKDGTAVFDLLLMDIFMGESNGFDVAMKIREINHSVPIAFLTVSRDYAIESYDVEAAGYLLKLVEEEKLFTLLSKLTRTEVPKSLTVKQRGRMKKFDYREIIYMESRGHRVTIHLDKDIDEIVYYKLDDLEKELDDDRFVRCHKSYLVNMDFVKYVEDDFQMSNNAVVPIRTHGRKNIINHYTNYFVKKHIGGEIR